MIANTDMFNTYSGNYEDSPEALMLKEAFLTSAEEIVEIGRASCRERV